MSATLVLLHSSFSALYLSFFGSGAQQWVLLTFPNPVVTFHIAKVRLSGIEVERRRTSRTLNGMLSARIKARGIL
jgi:hypothetical protein